MSAGNSATPPAAMQRSKLATSSGGHGARPTVTRSRPARSRQVAASLEQLAHRLRLGGRVLERDAACPAGAPATSARIASSPSAPADQRAARLVARDLRLRARPTRPRARRAGSRPPGRTRPAAGRRATVDLERRARAARRSRARRRPPRARRSEAVTRRSGRSSQQRQRDRPRAGADVVHARALRAARARPPRAARVSGPRDQHARGPPPARCGGSPCCPRM